MEHKKDTRKIAKNTSFLYIRMMLIMVVQFFTVRITLKALGVEDYGIYNVVCGVTNVFTFLTHTMTSAAQRFFAFDLGRDNVDQLRKSFDTIILIFAIMGFAVVALLQIFGTWIVNSYLVILDARLHAAQIAFLITNAMLFVTIITIPINSLIIAHEDMNVFAYISIVDALAKVAVVYLLYIIKYDVLITYALLLLVVSCLPTVLYWIYGLNHYPECDKSLQIDKKMGKKIIPYMSWNLLGGISWMLCTQGLSILVNLFFGPIINAAKAISDKISASITSFSNSFMTATQPQIVKTYAAEQMEDMHKVILFASNVSLYLMYIIAVPIIFNTRWLLTLWLGDVPETAVEMTQLILIFAHISALENPINQAIRATGNIKDYQLKLSFITLLVLPVAYLFFKCGLPAYWGYMALILVYGIAFIYRLSFLKKQVGISYSSYYRQVVSRQIKCIPILICGMILYSCVQLDSYIAKFTLLLLEIISAVVIIYLTGLRSEERNKLSFIIIQRIKKH